MVFFYMGLMLTIPLAFMYLDSYISRTYSHERYMSKSLSVILSTLFALVATWCMSVSLPTDTFLLAEHMILLWFISIAMSTDLHSHIVPFRLTVPAIAICLGLSIFHFFAYDSGSIGAYIINYLIPPLAVFVIFVIHNSIGQKWDAKIGGGDILIFVAIACIKGWLTLLILVFFAIFALVAPLMMLKTKDNTFALMPSIFMAYIIFVLIEHTMLI